MKKIIAAALSVLLGALGYTVVDKTMEDRVATLESEVVELKEVASRYHPATTSTTSTSSSTSNPYYETSTTKRRTTTSKYFSTTSAKGFGYFLNRDSSSRYKFLLRKFSNGKVQYISPDYLNNKVTTTASQSNSNNISYEDYFLTISDSTFKVAAMREEVSYSYWYDRDYNIVSHPQTKFFYDIEVKCSGFTDPALNGCLVDFDFIIYTPSGSDLHYSSFYSDHAYKKNIIKNKINPDGSFDYVCVITFNRTIREDFLYSLDDIEIKYPDLPTTYTSTTTCVTSSTCASTTISPETTFN